MTIEHIVHTIPPTFDARSRVLVLGSLPSPKSREARFNYGHPRNRFWPVMARLAGEPVPSTVERKRDFCLRHHIALWDVVAECDIEGASDSSIRNALPNDLSTIADIAPIEAVFCTGSRAHDLYGKLGCERMTGLQAIKLPSTSPANAACSVEKLEEEYARIFDHAHEFAPPVLDVARVVELEQQIAKDGTPLSELMDRAGTALANRTLRIIDEMAAGTYDTERHGVPESAHPFAAPGVTFLCGNGNNGGDGWVAAEILARAGIRVALVSQRVPDEIRAQPAHDAAVRSHGSLMALGGSMLDNGSSVPRMEGEGLPEKPAILINPDEQVLEAVLARSQVIVDAVLGTGFDAGAVKEPFCGWIRCANEIETAAKLACDVPSGVSAQNGYGPHQTHVRFLADETLTMIVPKPGLSARECGTVHVAPLAYIEPYFV